MGRFSISLHVCAVLLPAALVACGDDTSEEPTTATASSSATTSGPTTTGGPTAGPGSSSGGDGGDAPSSTSSGEAGGSGDGGGGEGGGTPCQGADGCDDGNVCTDDACVDGFCANVAVDDGTPIEPDGVPCTDDECLDGEETHTPKPAGAVPSDEDDCAGLCQAAPYQGICGLSLYRKVYPGGDDVWTRDAVSSIWMGPDSPPPINLREAEQTFGQDRLLVWSGDGTVYERQDGVWLPHMAATDKFENLDSGQLVAMTVAHAPTFGVYDETLTITTNEDDPQVLVYTLLADGSIAYASGPDPIGNAQLGDPEAPPQHTTPYSWGFAVQTAEAFQDEEWLHFWESLGGDVYDLDGSSGGFDFLGSEPEADSALFAGDGGPAPGSVVGAYYDAASGQVFLIAP